MSICYSETQLKTAIKITKCKKQTFAHDCKTKD